jgi:alginate production protein
MLFRGDRTERPSLLEPELALALRARPAESLFFFVELELTGSLDAEAGTGGYRGTQGELKELFGRLDITEQLQLIVGRYRYKDMREWIWDDELDGVRLTYRRGPLQLEAAATRRDFLPLDFFQELADELINNYFASATYTINKEVDVAAYILARDDLTDRRNSPVFIGLQADGDLTHNIEFSLNLATVRGRDGAQELRGYGGDVAATWEFSEYGRQALTGAYAYGSGDPRPGDGVNSTFRQTGLQENEDKFHGVTRFKYYGAAFDPDLSNLNIFTVGYSFRPSARSSVDVIGHYYVQDVAAPMLRGNGLGATPTGHSAELGSGVDVVFGFRESKRLDLRVVGAVFIPGDGLSPVIGTSYFAGLDLQVKF